MDGIKKILFISDVDVWDNKRFLGTCDLQYSLRFQISKWGIVFEPKIETRYLIVGELSIPTSDFRVEFIGVDEGIMHISPKKVDIETGIIFF